MKYDVELYKGASKIIAQLKKSNPTAFKILEQILFELSEHPRTGIGRPEPLKRAGGVTWSRRYSKKDRIIYDIFDEKVIVHVIKIGGHYYDT